MPTTIGASITSAALVPVTNNAWRAAEAARLREQGAPVPGSSSQGSALRVVFSGPASRWTITLTRDSAPTSTIVIGEGGTDDREIDLSVPTYSLAVQGTDPLQRNAASYLTETCTLTLAFASGETASVSVGGDGWSST